MASTSETGHAKNVANFQDLIAFATGYGTTYNPSKNALKLAQLATLKATAETHLSDVIATNTVYNTTMNARSDAFRDLKSLATRLVNALETTDASAQTIKDAKGFNRKIQGKRAPYQAPVFNPNAPAPTTISSSQMSFDQQIQHLGGLIAVLQSEPSYAPNETDLTIATIVLKQADLTAKNNAVAQAYANVSNSRIARNSVLYGTDTGIKDIAVEVKKYIKSVYGATSPQFAQVKGIPFTRR